MSSASGASLPTDRPKVSIVVVNWNGVDDLADELPSLFDQEYPNYDVTVVDNGSSDGSEALVAETDATWIGLGENRGLAAALNVGAERTDGGFILFLNNDMAFPPDFLGRVVDTLSSDPSAFAVDARQIDWKDGTAVHERTRLRSSGPQGEMFSWWDCPQGPTERPTTCLFASAASILVRRDRFELIGGWDGAYPVGHEDMDLCWRAWRAGWPTLYEPRASCRHKVGASTLTEVGLAARLRGSLYGRLRFALKQLPWFEAGTTLILGVAPLPLDLLRRPLVARARVSVLAMLLREFPALMRDRRQLIASTGESPSRLLRRLTRV